MLMLNALFLGFRRLVTNFLRIKWFFRKSAIKSSNASVLLNLLKTLYLGFVDVHNYCAVDFVELVQVADAALDQLNKN